MLGAVVLHAPVLRYDLLKPLKRPISNRLFGSNKTWRGALVMFTGVLLATGVRLGAHAGLDSGRVVARGGRFDRSRDGARRAAEQLPQAQARDRAGERRLTPGGIALVVYDQADFVPGIALCLLPVWTMPLDTLLIGFVAVAAVHFGVNVVGYAIGARDQPI